ncbi:GTP-binding protein [Marinobacter fuscus]|uniref:GTP-binding protein n=1 Tax=Marinobacter fuscus TaxID=2109942 RepID=A0A2T1K4D4_9GAMM|nr:ATP/GTP-binding protein [Marinobacter fuscus]PSF05026.1 GTP-binding protein [Marinobacter fuscus]
MNHKIIFAGPVGAGKTTAINTISDKPVVTTEAEASDAVKERKATTTVAMDFGVLKLDDGTNVHLYGTPGQQRFDYMWEILVNGGLGLAILIDNASDDPLADLEFYIESFKTFLAEKPLCVGVTRMDLAPAPRLSDYNKKLAELGIRAPIYEVDARKSNDVKTLVRSLLYTIAMGG